MKQWRPVPDGEYAWSDREGIAISNGGAELNAHVRPLETYCDSFGEPHGRLLEWECVIVELPDNLRLCELVPADAPATAQESSEELKVKALAVEVKKLLAAA